MVVGLLEGHIMKSVSGGLELGLQWHTMVTKPLKGFNDMRALPLAIWPGSGKAC